MAAVINNNVGAVRVLGRITRIQWSKEELLSRARYSVILYLIRVSNSTLLYYAFILTGLGEGYYVFNLILIRLDYIFQLIICKQEISIKN